MAVRKNNIRFSPHSVPQGLVNGKEWSLLGKLLLQSGLGNQVGGQRRATGEAEWANVILCRPFRDSILSPQLPGTHVPGSGLFRPYGTSCVASIGLSGQRAARSSRSKNWCWRPGQHQGFSSWTARSTI